MFNKQKFINNSGIYKNKSLKKNGPKLFLFLKVSVYCLAWKDYLSFNYLFDRGQTRFGWDMSELQIHVHV